MTIGIAIPSCKSYLHHLENLLDNISQQTFKPDQVSVSISDIDHYTPKKDYGFNLIITTHKESKKGDENRHIASLKLTTDLVSFFDCDDLMHPSRTEKILKIFEDKEILALTHGYDVSKNVHKNNIHTLDEFLKINEELVVHKNVIDTVNDKTFFPVSSTMGEISMHNAHVTVRKEVLNIVSSHNNHIYADSVFNSDLVKNGIKISFCPNLLSYYNIR